jgi:hypothetical protein
MQEELPVPFGPADGALDDGGSEAKGLDARLHAVARRLMLGGIAHDASLADLTFANFELRLDQDDHLATFR